MAARCTHPKRVKIMTEAGKKGRNAMGWSWGCAYIHLWEGRKGLAREHLEAGVSWIICCLFWAWVSVTHVCAHAMKGRFSMSVHECVVGSSATL